jgi:hypothetical protein
MMRNINIAKSGYLVFCTILFLTCLNIPSSSQEITMEWEKIFGGDRDDVGYCVQNTSDSGFIVTGYFETYKAEVCLIKMDGEGTTLWLKTLGGNDFGQKGFCVQQTIDGGYIITGHIYFDWDHANNYDVLLTKTDILLQVTRPLLSMVPETFG